MAIRQPREFPFRARSLQTASALVAIRPTQRFRSLVGAEREIALCESFDLDTDAEGASVNLKCEKALTL